MAQAYVYEDDATGWRHIQAGDLPSGTVSPLTTKGDVYGFDTADARIPVGADGTVLTADSAQALGVKWAAGGGSSPLTTKGDIFGHSTVDARVPVGADGQVLQADSTKALGVKWGPVPSGSGGALTLLGSSVLGANALTMSVSSIPSGYSHLEVVTLARTATASTIATLLVTFNGDTTAANYQTQYTGVVGSATFNANQFTASSGVVYQCEGNLATASLYGTARYMIPGYTQALHKVASGHASRFGNETGAGQSFVELFTGLWKSTAAITSITVAESTGVNLLTGSGIYVYGVS